MISTTHARALVALSLASTLAGCTVIADVGSYKTDDGCDLSLQMIDFSAHFSGPHRMEYFVVKPDAAGADGGAATSPGSLASVLVLEPTPAIDFDVFLPNAVPDRGHELRFYADTNNNGIVEPQLDGQTQDHTWILSNACDPRPNPFRHVFIFQEFTRPRGFGTDLVVRFSNIPEAGGAFELRVVVALPDPARPSETIERTVGGFHKPSRDDGAGTDADPFVVRIPGLVDSGVDYTLEAWADGDGDGLFDPNDDGGPFAGTDDRFWRIERSGADLDDPLTPFEFDVTTPQIAGQNEHSGVIMVNPR